MNDTIYCFTQLFVNVLVIQFALQEKLILSTVKICR